MCEIQTSIVFDPQDDLCCQLQFGVRTKFATATFTTLCWKIKELDLSGWDALIEGKRDRMGVCASSLNGAVVNRDATFDFIVEQLSNPRGDGFTLRMEVPRQMFVDSFRAAQREWAAVQTAMQAAQVVVLEATK